MSTQKSEKPTPKKLRDAKKKGQVPRSKELVSALTTLGCLVIFFSMSSSLMANLSAMFNMPIAIMNRPFELVLTETGLKTVTLSMAIVFPVIAMVIMLVVLGSIAQGGWVFATEMVDPKLENLSPKKALKNVFSMKNLMELVKSIIKAVALTFIIYFVIRHHISDLIYLPDCGLSCIFAVWGILALKIFAYSTALYLAIAIFDTFLQQRQYIKGLMMSLEEVKKEYKETEGDAHIKGMRTNLYREIISEGVSGDVAQSSAIITNPTHLAIGIYYEKGKTDLPLITLMEHGRAALAVRKLAFIKDIPIVENKPLARQLMATGKKRKYIPVELIDDVATVLKFVEKLKKKQD